MDTSYGLFPIYEPRGPIKADIIVVSGLQPYLSTWTHLGAPRKDLNWLEDTLPSDFPDYRIFSYGFEESPRDRRLDRSPPSIGELATNLLSSYDPFLYWSYDSNSNIPIIFIAHSLGGILVKLTLYRSKNSQRYHTIYKNTKGIIFLGTPHRVSPHDDVVSKALRATGSDPAKVRPILDSLALDSSVLQDINEAFLSSEAASRYIIANFYEELPTQQAGGKVVDSESSTIEYPNVLNIPLRVDHENLIQFQGPNDSNYLTLITVLKQMEQKAKLRRKVISKIQKFSISDTRLQNVYAQPALGDRRVPPSAPPTATMVNAHIYRLGSTGLDGEVQPSVSDLKSVGPKACLLQADSGSEADEWGPKLIWVHIPVNNSAWVHSCLRCITTDFQFNLTITLDKYWRLNQLKSRTDLPHARHMLPSCYISKAYGSEEPSSTRNCTQLALYIPYLHWDTQQAFEVRSKFLQELHEGYKPSVSTDLPKSIQNLFSMIKSEPNRGSSFHPRRSLDQYFYSKLSDTTLRDKDQVVSKYTRDSRGGTKMVIVDQLWLWVIVDEDDYNPVDDQSYKEAAVFTCFAPKEKESAADLSYQIADLRQAILDEATADEWQQNLGDRQRERLRQSKTRTRRNQEFTRIAAIELAGLIVEQAVRVMLQVRTEESLNFLEIFREAISDAAEKQTLFFRKFQDNLHGGGTPNTTLGQKHEEVRLVLEVADIIDELNTITRLLEVQRDTLKTAIAATKNRPLWRSFRNKMQQLADRDVADYLIQVKRMMKDAQRTHRSLLDLLDLQQKEANLFEARASNQQSHLSLRQAIYTRIQADETKAQSQIIFLFTIVTIIFLPLSFFTSYFGMNVTELTGDTANQSTGHVWKIMGPTSFAIIFSLLAVAWVFYLRAREEARKNREVDTEDWNRLGVLPPAFQAPLANTHEQKARGILRNLGRSHLGAELDLRDTNA